MKQASRFLSAAIIATAAASASAKTTTWTGGATGKAGTAMSFLAAANWDNGVPEPGDTVVINASTAWDNPVYIGQEAGSTDTAETFDIGSAGLTFDISSNHTKLLVNFTGSGKIVKTGTGMFGPACASSFTGGIEIRNGNLGTWKSGTTLFGTGAIEFVANGTTPKIAINAYNAGIKNDLSFSGTDSYVAFSGGNLIPLDGNITSTHDLEFAPTYGGVTFYHSVSAPGCTLTLNGNRDASKDAVAFTVGSSINADIVAKGNQRLNLNGKSQFPGNTLEIQSGRCTIGANGFWGGDIVLSGSATNLTLNGAANLSPSASVTIEEGCPAKLYIAGGTATVKSLSVGGVPVEDGTYTASTLPAAIGSGTLIVNSAKRTVWIGGVTGTGSASTETPQSFFDPSNWDNGVPAAGDTIIVTNSTAWNRYVYFGTSGETLDLGTKGITIDNTGWIKCAVKFTGSGKVVKLGSGTFGVSVDSEHTGGTELYAGYFLSYKGSLGFGTGPIEFVASASATPMLSGDVAWAAGITNALVFSGAVTGYKVFSPGNEFHFRGPISATHDFEIEGRNGQVFFYEDIFAPNCTFTVNANKTANENNPPHVNFAKSVDANIVKTGNRTMFLNGSTANPDHSLTVSQGTCSIAAAGYWGGTNVVVGASATALSLNGSRNLAPEAVVRITTTGGAKIDIASGIKVQIAKLFVNGTEQAPGVYNASSLPAVISGAGRLCVGAPATVLYVR